MYFHGVVELISALFTIFISNIISVILPYMLAFAAGSMIYVVVCELIPDTQEGKYSKVATFGTIIRIFIYDDIRCEFWLKNIKNIKKILKKNFIDDILFL